MGGNGFMKLLTVIDKQTNRLLNAYEVLEEVNRDRSSDWSDYTVFDLVKHPEDLMDWIDSQYYTMELK
jgi:hypothetical protein